jgi:serine/threonine protein kinase
MDVPLSLADLLALEGPVHFRQSTTVDWAPAYGRVSDTGFSLSASDSASSPILSFQLTPSIQLRVLSATCISLTGGPIPLLELRAAGQEDARRWLAVLRTLSQPQEHLSMDDFTILSVIGRGFLAKVLLVQKKTTRELFALKAVSKAKLGRGRIQRIIAERNIMLLVDHPFIVQLHFAFQTDTKFYLGLEYAPGGELYYYLSRNGVLGVNEARLYCAELALALDSLHQLGVIYRDLKPENILIDHEGHLLLTDFGLSKLILDEGEAVTGTFCGTSGYLAPEIVGGRPYSYGVDWWALGVLMCEMLSGKQPFRSPNVQELYSKILNDAPDISLEIPPTARSLIANLLTKNPTSRPLFDQISSHPFFEGLDWERLAARGYTAPWTPPLPKELKDVTANFDPDFTREQPLDSIGEPVTQENVVGFSFVAPPVADEGGEVDASALAEFEHLAMGEFGDLR